MKTGYKGDQPFETWLKAWETNTCETLARVPATNMSQPAKNLAAITAIVTALISQQPNIDMVDLKDEAKYACNRKNLAYDANVMGQALDAATRQRRML